MALPAAIAAAFAAQAGFCRRLGAPFTALVCEAAVLALNDTSATGRAVAGWRGDALADALMMRLAGGCNALVRAGRAPALAALYPPAALPDLAALAAALARALTDAAFDAELCGWLAAPPQTNEVARAGVLMPGLMVIAAAARLPLRLFEPGCSAGLNLNLDRFGYDLAGIAAGDPASPVRLAPAWQGPPPPAVAVRIAARHGADLAPLDVADAATRARLLAFVWPDQPERVARAEAAIVLAREFPPPIDRADAADWIERRVAPAPGSTAVVLHSIAWQYFPGAVQRRIESHMAAIGTAASPAAPVAWLRYEMDDPGVAELPTLRLTLWRGGAPSAHLLARAHPHGTFVQWH